MNGQRTTERADKKRVVTGKMASPRVRPTLRSPAGAAVDKRSSYHHGNLHEALVARGIEILEGQGPAALSFRGIARDLGVSPTAPLYYFPNTAAYLAAIAAQGFCMLYGKCTEVLRNQRNPRKRLLKVMMAHLQFAGKHGALFQVMYGAEIPDKTLFPELESAAARSYGVLQSCVGDYLKTRNGALGRTHPTALAAWIPCHALATMMVNRRSAWHIMNDKDPMKIGREFFDILIAGLEFNEAMSKTTMLLND